MGLIEKPLGLRCPCYSVFVQGCAAVRGENARGGNPRFNPGRCACVPVRVDDDKSRVENL